MYGKISFFGLIIDDINTDRDTAQCAENVKQGTLGNVANFGFKGLKGDFRTLEEHLVKYFLLKSGFKVIFDFLKIVGRGLKSQS